MSGAADNLLHQLEIYGLTHDEAMVYLHLLRTGTSSALQLSKGLKIARTKIYRLLEKLVGKGFVKEEIRSYGTHFAAESYEKINLFIEQKEQELLYIKNNAPELFNQLSRLQIQDSKEYKILHYRGVEGLKQVTWNSTKAKDTFRIYEIKNMEAFLDFDFSEHVRMEFVKNNIPIHQLTDHGDLEMKTNIERILEIDYIRYIDPSDLPFNMEILIYNNVYCMYSYEQNDIFCVEIHNQKLADMQKKIFDFVWKHAQPMNLRFNKGILSITKK